MLLLQRNYSVVPSLQHLPSFLYMLTMLRGNRTTPLIGKADVSAAETRLIDFFLRTCSGFEANEHAFHAETEICR